MIQVAVVGARGIGVSHLAALRQLPGGHVRGQRRLVDSSRRGLDIVASGRVDYASLATHRYRLAEIDNAYADMRAKPQGFVKAVIVP